MSGDGGHHALASQAPRPVRAVARDRRLRAALLSVLGAEPGLGPVSGVALRDALAEPGAVARDGATVVLMLGSADETAGVALVTQLLMLGARAVVVLAGRDALRPAALRAGAAAFLPVGADPVAVVEAVRAA
ncbi:MAG: hypothetical protein U0Y82_02610 [Thermoleophilia bacterium]